MVEKGFETVLVMVQHLDQLMGQLKELYLEHEKENQMEQLKEYEMVIVLEL